jgi:1-deoxy-D-xylulose-5-phosphate synthase
VTTNRGLSAIRRPADLRGLGPDELTSLAAEIRGFLIKAVSRTGGHLGPNLGVVELSIALHRVFESPQDTLIWDTGHQAYVHKLLTGRQEGWDRLKKTGGLSGYPSRAESEHDHVESSHASSSLSWADGIARAHALTGVDRHVVAVIGDGALTGGMAWEALNNIAAGEDRNVVVVVNDNGRSYSPTIGGLADRARVAAAAARLRAGARGRQAHRPRHPRGRARALRRPARVQGRGEGCALPPGAVLRPGAQVLRPGRRPRHRPARVRAAPGEALRRAGHRAHGHPQGQRLPARGERRGRADAQPGAFDPETGLPTGTPVTGWTDVFAEEMVALGSRRTDVVAITAAMLGPTGLAPFAARPPGPHRRRRDRRAARADHRRRAGPMGRAAPRRRALRDVPQPRLRPAADGRALHASGVTLVLDRSGVTGSDGPSHNGMWDLSLLGIVPGMRVAAPRDEETLREEFREATAVTDGPTALRYPKGSVIGSVPALRRLDGPAGVDVLHEPSDGRSQVLLVCVGAFATSGVAVARRLADQGVDVTVVDPRWVLPVPRELLTLAADHQLVVTVSDCGTHGGFGSALSDALRAAELDVRQRDLALPQEYLEHGSRDDVLAATGLTEQDMARRITEWAAAAVPSTPEGAVPGRERTR